MSETSDKPDDPDGLQFGYEDGGPNCLIGSHGILFSRVQETPHHNAAEYARKFAAVDDLLAFAKAHEQWEANLILSDKAWDGGMAEFPRLTQELYDEFMEVQALRNAAIAKATAPKGPTP